MAQAQKPLILGIIPSLTATGLYDQFTPLADYLSRKIGQPVTVAISKDYRTHIDQIGQDKIDIAFVGPVPYLEVIDLYGKKPLLARLENKGAPTFQGIIIVARDSPIRTLADLKGNRFAFGEKDCTMGSTVPLYMLWEAGVTLDTLARYDFLNNHDNVSLAVLMGDFDAGAVKEEVFYEYEKRGLRAIAKTPPISERLFVTSSSLSDEKVRVLRDALLDLKKSKEGRAILSAIGASLTGMVDVHDEDYDNLRVIIKQVKKLGITP